MSDTVHLGLPFLSPAQAQKHVTHNEALGALDTLVQLSVLDRDLATPPASPAEGDRYIVAGSPTGAWAGQAGKVAAWRDGGWTFHVPREGWRAWVADENTLLVHDGSVWADYNTSITTLQNLALLGVNTTADAGNKLAVRSNAVLVTSLDAADGGTGDAQLKLDKETAGDTASFVFQTGASGRAELGLAGDDDFHLKVSPDGSAWADALVIDKTDGSAAFDCGASFTVSIGGMPRGELTASQLLYRNTVTARGDGTTAALVAERFQDGTSTAPTFSIRKAAGSEATPVAVALNSNLGSYQWQSHDGAGFGNSASLAVTNLANPVTSGNRESRMVASLCAAGSASITEAWRFDLATGFSMMGANVVIDQNRLHCDRTATLGTLHAGGTGKREYATDLGGGAGPLHHDGTRWRRHSDGGYQTVATDVAFTLAVLTDAECIRHSGTLTANRAVTLSTAGAYLGAKFRITRTGAGAFTLDVGAGPLKSLGLNAWADVVYDGSAWYLAASGTL